jgi:acetyl-CoA carboxylase biotin carboxyl carrier protein
MIWQHHSPITTGGSTMADEGSRNPGPFDVHTIKELVSLMRRHDLSEIDLRDGPQRLRLRRRSPPASVPPAAAAAVPAPPVPAQHPIRPPEPDKPGRALLEIKSPTPGTFYSASSPGAEPLVRVGSRVSPNTVVGLIEAMKLFNEIPAECTGIIVEVMVENGQAVEYGQVLFRVDPTT